MFYWHIQGDFAVDLFTIFQVAGRGRPGGPFGSRVLSFRSQSFQSLRDFSNQAMEGSMIHRLGIMANRCGLLLCNLNGGCKALLDGLRERLTRVSAIG